MKVFLTVPLTVWVKDPPSFPDLGLGYLASHLEKEGHEVYIHDWNMPRSVEVFRERLLSMRPEVIGIKLFTKDAAAALKTVNTVKETLPESIIVAGGPHISAMLPQEVMESFSLVDFAIQGEGEAGLPLLLNEVPSLDTGKRPFWGNYNGLSKVPGLVWRGENAKVFSNERFFISDIDQIDMPAWELINPRHYSSHIHGSSLEGAMAPILATRGCPGRCSFCNVHLINGKRIRSRSAENIFSEIDFLYRGYDVRRLSFHDTCFISKVSVLQELCNLIIENKLELEWDCIGYHAALENLTDENLKLMKKAGSRMINISVESASERIRRIMLKGVSLERVTGAVQRIRRNGIDISAFFMLGFPDETEEEMKETIQCAFDVDAQFVSFSICFPLPGTDFYEFLKQNYGIAGIDWATFDIISSPYSMSRVPARELEQLIKRLKIKLALRSAWRGIKARFFGA